MAPVRRSHGASKHALHEILDDPTLEAKCVILKKPVDWEEDEDGELQSTSAPDLDDPPKNCFLKLPTELRIKIYRYCLTQDKPIQVIPWPYIPKLFAVGLLRTCKLMHDECAQILYGENEYRFFNRLDHVRLLGFLRQVGPDHRAWLRHLTVQIPFHDDRHALSKHPDHLSGRSNTGYSDSNVYYKDICPELSLSTEDELYDVEQITWGYLVRSLVCTLQSLPQLRDLTFVLPSGWLYRDEHRPSFKYRPEWMPPDTEVVWTCLQALLHAKPFLNVSVVQTLDDSFIYINPVFSKLQENQRRFLANLRRRLGIWDFRVVHCEKMHWKMPGRVEEDPDEYLRDLRCLFAGRTI